jgi:hypothetical protein
LEETAALFDDDDQQLELASTGGKAVRLARETLTYRGTPDDRCVYKDSEDRTRSSIDLPAAVPSHKRAGIHNKTIDNDSKQHY